MRLDALRPTRDILISAKFIADEVSRTRGIKAGIDVDRLSIVITTVSKARST